MSEKSAVPFGLVVETPEPWLRVIKVEVPRAEYDVRYRERLSSAVKGYLRPGFRKGKTPRGLVEKELGGRLRAETFEALVPEAYRAAVIEHRLFPITEPTLENLVFEDDKDLSFDLKVEVRPEVTATGYDGLTVTERTVEVTGAEVDEVLERLRESRHAYEKVDRAAENDDQVVLDLAPRGENGEIDEEKRMAKQRVILGSEQNLPVFNEALAGVVADQELEISVPYPEDYPNPELQGKSVTFACKIDSIRTKVVPEADDALASQLEEGQTLLELRARIREGLEEEATKRVAQELDDQVLDQLIAANEVPVPPSMVKAWLESGLQDLHQRNEQMGRPASDEEDEQYREAAKPVAERQIKGMFLLESVRRAESIEVSDEEIDEKIESVAAEHGFDVEKYREYVQKGEEKDRLRHGLEERKTYDFLLSRAEVTPADADAKPQDETAVESEDEG